MAQVAYGFGSGGGTGAMRPGHPSDGSGEGAGGGGGVRAVPAGVVEITRGQTRFLRFGDRRRLAAAAAVGFGLGLAFSKWSNRQTPRGGAR